MRIGVNALYLVPGGVGGTEIYLRHLLRALGAVDPDNEYVVFTNRETGPDIAPALPNFLVAQQPVRARFRPARIAWEQTGLPLAVRRLRLDVLLNPGFTAPVFCSCPAVTVFHDLQHKRHPEYFRWFDLPFWRLLLWAAAQRSTLLLAVSEATRADLLRYYRLPESRIHVVLEGVDSRMFEIGCERRPPFQPMLLCVSTLHPHKNLDRLLGAFAQLRGARPEFRLVIAGLRGFHAAALERRIRELRLEDAVRLTGWIPRQDLYALFRDAFAFVYPSTFEGFGLPLLEALAAGIPTACSSIEPLATLAGGAALQFDPSSPTALLEALDRLVSDEELRRRLAIEGPPRASEFSWEKAAEKTLTALKKACAAPLSER
jgi:glycosyltransferase involved in cell wall biosynthesis